MYTKAFRVTNLHTFTLPSRIVGPEALNSGANVLRAIGVPSACKRLRRHAQIPATRRAPAATARPEPAMNNSDQAAQAQEQTAQAALGKAYKSPYQDTFFLGFVFCTLLYSIIFILIFSLVPLYFKQELFLSEAQIGVLMALNGILIVIIEMALVYAIEKRFARHKIQIISLGVLLTGLSYGLFLTTYWPVIALIAVLSLTVGEMLTHPFLQSFAVERSSPHNRGQYLALHSMAFALAQVTSPAIAAQIVDRAGFPALWITLVGISLASASGFWWLGRKGG